MPEPHEELGQLTRDQLIDRAVKNNDLMLRIEGFNRPIVRSDIDWRSMDTLVELVARQERILINEGLLNNAERVETPT